MWRAFEHATVERIVDGDTLICRVDLGFKVFKDIRVRLHGIQAPHNHTVEGQEATSQLSALCLGTKVKLWVQKQDLYGRWVAQVTRINDGIDLGQELVRLGVAVVVKS